MALTRKFLKSIGLDEDKIDSIIESHMETVDALKSERDDYKKQYESLGDVQKELDSIKKDGWQSKYEEEHKSFEEYKKSIETKEINMSKADAYKKLLKESGISEKRLNAILKVTKLDDIKIEDGKLVNEEELKKSIQEEWSDFVVKEEEKGAETKTPPSGRTGTFEQMSLSEKMTYANAHPDDEEVRNWLKK